MPKIHLTSPVRGISGKFKDSDICFMVGKNGQSYARAAGAVDNPRTPSQMSTRSFMTAASKQWQHITEGQRQDWLDYSRYYFKTARDGSPLLPNGLNAFTKANTIRQLLGLSIVASAPLDGPPPGLSAIELLDGYAPDTLSINIIHSISAVAGLQVMVRMTNEMPTVSRTPRVEQLRYCCGVTGASAKALTATGTELIFSPTIYDINDGKRYGVEARIVRTADGMMSQPVFINGLKVI